MMMARVEATDDLVARADLADEFGLKVDTLRRWAADGRGPAWIKLGRKVFYRRSAIAAWVKSQERPRRSGSGHGASDAKGD